MYYDNFLRFTCVISHLEGEVPCAEFAMKSSPFAFEGTLVKLQQNNRKKPQLDENTLHVYRRKTTMQLVPTLTLSPSNLRAERGGGVLFPIDNNCINFE